jgi:mannose-6-phosphate isomerase
VHPNDEQARAAGEIRGKTEMWHILRAEPEARIAIGFEEPITAERLRQASQSGEIENLLRWFPVKAGETYYTPAGTVHAIGRGITLCEIQQYSDITYRLYDYGRPRELHLDQGVAVADLGVHPGASAPRRLSASETRLVESPYFITDEIRIPARSAHVSSCDRPSMFTVLEGEGEIAGQPYHLGEGWFATDAHEPVRIDAGAATRLLRCYAPAR